MKTIRLLAGLVGICVMLIPLAVTVVISYKFGRDLFGEGSVMYGVLYAAFAVVASVATLAGMSARDRGQRRAAIAVALCCMLCSGAGSMLSLGARQDELSRAEAARVAARGEVLLLQRDLAALRISRDRAAIEAEQRLREQAYAASRERHRAARERAPWTKTPEEVARDLELVNELSALRRAADMKTEIDKLLSKKNTGPRPTAVISWVAGKIGWEPETTGQLLMLGFVLTTEVVNALGLYVIIGSMVRAPAGGGQAAVPEREQAPATASQPAPLSPIGNLESVPSVAAAPAMAAEQVATDPVEAFLTQIVKADPDATTAYSDIEDAWRQFCTDRGLDGVAVNLGFALTRCGYKSVRLPGGRKMGRKGLKLAA